MIIECDFFSVETLCSSSATATASSRTASTTHGFDEVFRSESVRVIRAPVAAPKAKAHAERWVGSVRRECLDPLLIVSRKQLERVLREYVEHYNTHRPHRALEQRPPLAKPPPPRGCGHDLVRLTAGRATASAGR